MLASPPADPPPAIASAAPPAAPSLRPRSPAPVRIVRYGFEHAELGMSLADWRAAAPDHAQAPCAPAPADPHTVVCEPAPALDGAFSKRDRRAVFVDGVLTGLSFSTSIDSFDGVMARLDQTYGKPARVVRDTVRLADGLVLPHVLMTWTNGLATIRVADPEPPAGRLTVRATLNADAERSTNARL